MLVLYNKTELWSQFIKNVQPLENFTFYGLRMRSNYHSIFKKILRRLVGNRFGLKIDFVNSNLEWIEEEKILLLGIYPIYELINIYRILGKRKYILWLWNPISRTYFKDCSRKISIIKSMGFNVFTFDKKDSIEYGLEFLNQFVSLPKVLPQCDVLTDVYFVGYPKGREEKLTLMENELKKKRITTDFHIVKNEKDYLSYEDNIRHTLSTKCVLEITQNNQSGMTLRCLEALFLKKKLITDNIDIINADFYNPNNIFVIGKDSENNIFDFINSPFVEVDNIIKEKYNFSSWLNSLCNYV